MHYRRWLTIEDGAYDVGSIELESAGANSVLWRNLDSSGGTNHTDREWRFPDVELTDALADGSGRITFKLASDQGTEHGGWTIDDFCIIGYNLPVCGDGNVTGDETCDDGNTEDGDGCNASCLDEEDPDDPDDPDDPRGEESGCGCQSSGAGTGSLVLGLFALVAIGRRRRR